MRRVAGSRCSRCSRSRSRGAHRRRRHLDELLEQTRNSARDEAQANAAREQEFLANRDQQAALLAEAQRERDAAEARSKQLSAQFDANELQLNELETLLKQRSGNLGELFGVTRQVAGDGSAV